VKMNVDTDMQYAFTRAIVDHVFRNYDEVLKVDGEMGNKKAYDPRTYLAAAEKAMAVRVTEAAAALRDTGTSMLRHEAAYFTSSSAATAEYGLYVVQLEQQSGEWLFVGGYAGETVTRDGPTASFSPERGVSRSILGRVSRNVGVNRTFAIEGAVHQDGHGAYAKGQYSQGYGQHWRATVTGVVLGGRDDDFFGQYRHNSHVVVAVRYSF